MCNLYRMTNTVDDNWARWTEGSASDALELCRTWPGTLAVERTLERWAGAAG